MYIVSTIQEVNDYGRSRNGSFLLFQFSASRQYHRQHPQHTAGHRKNITIYRIRGSGISAGIDLADGGGFRHHRREVVYLPCGGNVSGDARIGGPDDRYAVSTARNTAIEKCCIGAVDVPNQASLVITTSALAPFRANCRTRSGKMDS